MTLTLASIFDWFTNYGSYNTLFHCMDQDLFWIWATVALDVAVATGYALIAYHWHKNERHLPPTPAKRALRNLKNIFIFCGICGYVFIPIKMVWPAWRLYDMFMLVLAFYTWRYAWGAKDLKVIYTEMGRSKQLEADLERSREESNRKSFFLNAISHDLRTPLNGLLLQANLAEIGAASGDHETVRDAMIEVKRSAKATAELLNSFLEYARLDWAADANAVARFELPALLRDVVKLSTPAAEERNLYLRANAPANLYVETDRVKLERVLMNLVSNAVKFTHQGGVRIEVERQGQAVEIHVIDSGCGIAQADHERLFDEFYQVQNGERDRRKGFGLGLAIARRLARQLGGDVTVDSAVGRGSRFSVLLPGVARTDEVPGGVAAPAGAAMAVGA